MGGKRLGVEEEGKGMKGMIVNKFGGEVGLFEWGVKMMEEMCGIGVVGVIGY